MLVRFWRWLGFHVHGWSQWTKSDEVLVGDRRIGYRLECEACGLIQSVRIR